MTSNESAFLQLAGAVADGSSVDWDRAEASARDEAERSTIQQLRRLASLGEAARAHHQTWGPLTVRGEIGSGSFGSVYRAWDTRLEREVALKLLSADASSDPLASRIITEGRLLAQIRHPNVVTVHGADVFDARAGVWMELVSGRTLKEVVQSQGPYGAHEAALIGLDLCRALAAVHQKGFVHRDIKAQNVMREAGGRTVLMDFGATESKVAAASGGTLRGTPAYLAPEVLDGAPATVQSDLYSLGVLLFFLVSGEFPVVGSSLADFRDRHARGERKLLRDVRPDLPRAFVRAIDAATAASLNDRPASAGALEALLEDALVSRPTPAPEAAGGMSPPRPSLSPGRTNNVRWLALATTLAAVLIAGWIAASRRGGSETPGLTRNSVAILPFRNLTATPDDEYFSEGITADLIANLAALRDLRVIAGGSMRRYADRKKTPVEIGGELSVATVLDATIRHSQDRVRIVAQLIDARSGEQIWSDSFDSRLEDVVAMKSDVAHKIAVALKGELTQRDMESLRPGRTYDYNAFNLYLKGRHYWGLRTEEGIQRSIQYFHDALAQDASFAPAHAGLADAYTQLGVYGALPRQEAFVRAAAAAEKAVQLDPQLAEAHAALGYARKNRFEWAAAEESLRKAIDLKPGYATAHHWYSIFLTQHGRFAEAMTEIRLALSLDPLAIGSNLQLAALLMMSRRYDDAIAQYQHVREIDAGIPAAHRYIAMAFGYQGRFDQSFQEFAEASRKAPVGSDDQELKADYAYMLAAAGRTDEAVKLADQLTERFDRTGEVVAGSIAAIYAGLKRPDDAFKWLERARASRDPEAGYLKVDPKWDPIRSDPRFTALLKALGFVN